MNITKDCAVTLRLKVSDAQGQVIESGKEPVSYLHGGYGNLIAKLEQALEGQTVGFKGSWQGVAEQSATFAHFRHKKTRCMNSGFSVARLRPNHFSLISLYSTCLRAFGSNFMIDIFSGMVFLFLLVV